MLSFSNLSLTSRISVISLALVFGQTLTACGTQKAGDESEESESGVEDSDSEGSEDGSEGSDNGGEKSPGAKSGGGEKSEPGGENSPGEGGGDSSLTYYKDAKAIIDAKCGNCHGEGQIGGFPLNTYEQVYDIRKAALRSIEDETMPPWSPRRGCREYKHNRALTLDQKKILVDWLKGGANKGSRSDAPKEGVKKEEPIEYNMEMGMSEAWTPRATDENRCFLAVWPGKKVQYQKAFMVQPGEPSMLHHLLVYKVSKSQAERFHQFDRNDAGYGYNCPGGPAPNVHPNEVQLIGDWVPGQSDQPLPEGVGIRYEPGDLIIFQHHYNTAFTGKKPDKSRYRFQFVDKVERPAAASLFFNQLWMVPGLMPIPAGEKDAKVEWTFNVGQNLGKLAAQEIPGVSANEPLQVHFVGPHLHQLGSKAYVNVIRADGSKECLMETDYYDFDWQGFYTLDDEVILKPQDSISLRCHWNNTKENQPPLPDGTVPEPQFVSWGDRTRDEMCLLGIMVTRPKKGSVK